MMPEKRPAKTTVEKCLTLDAPALKRAGYLAPGPGRRRLDVKRNHRFLATLHLQMDESRLLLDGDLYPSWTIMTPVSAALDVVRTPTLNQGERVWFSCPGCGKPVTKLYLPPGQADFRCRTCHHLTYASQKKRPNIWRKVREEVPKLEKELRNPRLGEKRHLKAAQEAEKLHAQVKSASIQIEKLIPPGLLPILKELGFREIGHASGQVPPPPPLPTSEKRPRGRPKEKRPYRRQRPFHESERRTPAEAFCVKCRAYREPAKWKLVTFRNGRAAIQGICPVCGSKVARIITARGAELLASAPARPTGGADLSGFTPPSRDMP
jgi:hypothetical protein